MLPFTIRNTIKMSKRLWGDKPKKGDLIPFALTITPFTVMKNYPETDDKYYFDFGCNIPVEDTDTQIMILKVCLEAIHERLGMIVEEGNQLTEQ